MISITDLPGIPSSPFHSLRERDREAQYAAARSTLKTPKSSKNFLKKIIGPLKSHLYLS